MVKREFRFLESKPADQWEELWMPCNSCGRDTNHVVVRLVEAEESYFREHFDHQTGETHETGHAAVTYKHQIVRCKGCDSFSYRIVRWQGSFYPGDESVSIYPPRLSPKKSGRQKMSEAATLPVPVRQTYEETWTALRSDLRLLASVGIRTLAEQACEFAGTTGNLFGRINELVERGALSAEQANALHFLRKLGNSATHEGRAGTPEELSAGMDVAEHLIRHFVSFPAVPGSDPERRAT